MGEDQGVDMMRDDIVMKLLFVARNFVSRKMFKFMEKYCKGNVLDVGGGDFFNTIIKKKFNFLNGYQ